LAAANNPDIAAPAHADKGNIETLQQADVFAKR
jgi:hypothetical protein